MRHDRYILIASVLIVAVILAGEAYIYTFDRDSTYSASSSMSDSGAGYREGSGISSIYVVVVSYNGAFSAA